MLELRRLCSSSTLALALLVGAGAAGPAAAADSKVVILGFDGADAKLTARWMEEGKLPNLARLRGAGTFAPLRSTIPSQTPVSWSTFATGLNPGRHSIFDFLKRDTATYRPTFAAFEETKAPFLFGARNPLVFGLAGALAALLSVFLVLKLFRVGNRKAGTAALVIAALAGAGAAWIGANWIPTERPLAINRRQGEPFWKVLGAAGKRVRVMRVPVTFPPEPFPHGEMLSGLGTPDLSGRIGKPFYFTSELFWQPRGDNEVSIEVVELVDNRGTIPAEVVGPPNKLFPDGPDYIKIPIVFTVADDRKSLAIEVSGTKLSLAAGQWSEWVRFVFPFNPLLKVHGIGRFQVISIEPEVRVYLSPIQFDPSSLPPVIDVTAPRELAGELVERFGLFKTIGWMIDTWSIKAGSIDDDTFFQDVDFTVDKDVEMVEAKLAADDWDVYMHYFEFTDRVQHVMWRHTDPEHPLYRADQAAKYGDSILKAYQRMDAIVGKVMEKMPEGAQLFVVSDHGFAPWRRTMNYNTWLAQEGYLRLKGETSDRANLEDLFDQAGSFFSHVDWSRTRAYAMGLGNIYVNLAGREGQGIVQPGAEYEALVVELKAKLPAYVDPENGEKPVAYVFTRDEAYGTYDPALIPDLFPSNAIGYRVGWQDALGMIAPAVTEPNLDVWSADHCSVYPPLVDGILFSNRKLSTEPQPYMADVMPTVLELYGVPPPVQLDGRSLLVH
ncbi:MAG TPA: alkaline phosphatase family protein [Thermoanaerobaculia bacterium]|nr:alkaline phosphatase family protein [Thermoanaerobaculia bacterium]